MEQKSLLRQFPRVWRIACLFFAAAIVLASCSKDDPGGPDDGLVAVEFTATVDGLASPAAGRVSRSDGGPEEITGFTTTGVAYLDYVDKDGFETRAFYPSASRQSETTGAWVDSTNGKAGG